MGAPPTFERFAPDEADTEIDGPPCADWSQGARGPVAPRARPYRIVVAEDDAEMRHLVVDTLRDDGYDVLELSDGGRLLVNVAARMKAGVASEVAVDLVISDIRMPICTGLQILEVLRQAHWQTPVILMTAFGDKATRTRAEELGAILFDKPFDMDNLRMAVTHLLPPGGLAS
jgi:DNA-binding response OmpR family regulator